MGKTIHLCVHGVKTNSILFRKKVWFFFYHIYSYFPSRIGGDLFTHLFIYPLCNINFRVIVTVVACPSRFYCLAVYSCATAWECARTKSRRRKERKCLCAQSRPWIFLSQVCRLRDKSETADILIKNNFKKMRLSHSIKNVNCKSCLQMKGTFFLHGMDLFIIFCNVLHLCCFKTKSGAAMNNQRPVQ